jgi:membrane protein DedA with SNARE-associated domain
MLVPKNKYLLLVAIVTLFIGILQAASVVQLPFGAWFSKVTGSIISSPTLNSFMTNYGYLSLFVLMSLESASLPIPSEVVLPFAGYLVYLGTLSFWPVVIVSTAASLTGALVDYYLAKWLGRPFVIALLKLFRVHEGGLDRAESWFARSGQWTVFAARFVPVVRTIISLPAGLFEMGIIPFIVMTVSGCFAWSVILVYAGFLAPAASTTAFTSSPTVIQGLSALVAVVSAAYIAFYGLYRRGVEEPDASLPS